MSLMDPALDHAARGRSESERVDYLIAVASVVLADSHIDDAELAVLRRLCRALEVSSSSEEIVVEAAKSPARAKVESILGEIRRDVALRVSLLADAILVAFADGKLDRAETTLIADFAQRLSVSTGHAVMIARYVESVLMADRPGAPRAVDDSKMLSSSLADGLTAEWQARPKPAVVRWLYGALGGRAAAP